MARPMVEAEYRGCCPACEQWFEPGTPLTPMPGGWGHLACPPEVERLRRPVCERCWQERTVAGTCGCL